MCGMQLQRMKRGVSHCVHEERRDAPEQHVVAVVPVAHVLAARDELEVGVDGEAKARRAHGQVREHELSLRRALRRLVCIHGERKRDRRRGRGFRGRC